MTLQSCLYEGEVRHRRRTPVPHEFRYPLFLMYVDLDELPSLFRGGQSPDGPRPRRWLWSADRPNVAWFRRRDHFGPPDQPLAESVRDFVALRTGVRPAGPIRLLTHFRYFGFDMNPISLFYVFDRGERLEFVVAEVHNTPWNERHCYLLDFGRGALGTKLAHGGLESVAAFSTPKTFHVSPFLDMAYDYHWELSPPGERLEVRIENHRRAAAGDPLPDDSLVFEAALTLRRRELSGGTLAGALVRYPFLTARVYGAIYWQAFRLWRKGTPFVPHPGSVPETDPPHAASLSEAASLPEGVSLPEAVSLPEGVRSAPQPHADLVAAETATTHTPWSPTR